MRRDIDGRIRALAEELALVKLLDRPVGKLSSGQKTRVSLAKALLNSPDVLLLDEPTRLARSRHRRLGARPASNVIESSTVHVLLASHNMREVERLCDRVIIMKQAHRGRRHAARFCSALRPRNLEEVFLDVARGRGEAVGGAMTAQPDIVDCVFRGGSAPWC